MMAISNTCLEKEKIFYKFLRPFLGEGLIAAGNVSTWKTHRKYLNPVFSHSRLKSSIYIFNRQASKLIEKLDQRLGTPYNHEDVLKLNNLETICITATGTADNERIIRQKYIPLFTIMQQIFNDRFRRLWFYFDSIYKLSNLKGKEEETIKQLSDLTKTIIEIKRKEIKRGYEEKESKTHKSLLELMLENANEIPSFNDDQIKAEVNTMIFGGYETIGLTLNMILILLGSHLDVQEKVYNEIYELNKCLDTDLDSDDVSKLKYTEAVIKETLRLYPPVPVTARHVEKNIKINNYTLQANSTCILLLYALNRHPVWGPDANQFRPERWLGMATYTDMNHFASFSLGRRNCIGKFYAMLSMKITVAHLIRRYKISADISKVGFKWRLVSYPASRNKYTFERRTNEE